MEVAHRLATVRRSTGLSQRAFAAALQSMCGYRVSHTSVGQYENGTSAPAGYLQSVSASFDVSPGWLLTGRGLPKEVSASDAEVLLHRIADLTATLAPASGHVEAQLDAFFRLSPDPFLILTLDLHIVRWNAAFERIVGYPSAEIRDTPLLHWTHEDDDELVGETLAQVLQSAGEVHCEFRLRVVSGEYLPVECHANSHHNLVFAVLRDLTEPQRVASMLDESRRRQAAVFELAAEGIILFSTEGRYVDVNPAFCTITGYSREELLDMSVGQLTRPQEIEELREIYAHFIAGEQLTGSHTFVRKDGDMVRIEYQGVPHIMPDVHLAVIRPAPLHVSGSDHARRYAQALEHVVDCIMITDAGCVIEYVNPAFERTTGYTRAEALGQNVRLLRSDRHDDAFYEAMNGILARGGTYRGVIIHRRKNGKLYRDDRTIAPVMDERGGVSHFVSTGRDLGPVLD